MKIKIFLLLLAISLVQIYRVEGQGHKCMVRTVNYHFKSVSEAQFQIPKMPFLSCRLGEKNFTGLLNYSINRDDFVNTQNLKVLVEIKRSTITHLPTHLFSDFPKMDFLYMKENKEMGPLTSDFFQNSTDLTKLWIMNNKYDTIGKGVFQRVPNIEFLSLPSNEIREFEDGSLDDIPKLKGIFLKANHLTSLPKNLFKKLPDLEEIDLSGNRIQVLDVSLIKNPKIKNLFISENKIYAMNPTFFYKKPALKNCFFKDNACINKVFIIKDSLYEMKMELEDCFLNYTDITNEIFLLINENPGSSQRNIANSASNSTMNVIIILQSVVIIFTLVGIFMYVKLCRND